MALLAGQQVVDELIATEKAYLGDLRFMLALRKDATEPVQDVA